MSSQVDRLNRHFRCAVITIFLLAIFGCASHRQAKNDVTEPYINALSPLIDVAVISSGSVPLVYNVQSFRSKNGRWPDNYEELSSFVRGSDGYLLPGNYERAQLKQLSGDKLEIRYIMRGHTNEFKFTLDAAPKNN